jgi:hypothetical protein
MRDWLKPPDVAGRGIGQRDYLEYLVLSKAEEVEV